jgi:hypothetical protein
MLLSTLPRRHCHAATVYSLPLKRAVAAIIANQNLNNKKLAKTEANA